MNPSIDIISNGFFFALYFLTSHRIQNTLSGMQEEKRRTNVSKDAIDLLQVWFCDNGTTTGTTKH